jgi:hypothetical protein
MTFPTSEKMVSGATGISFGSSDGVDASHYYQVLAYAKENSPYTGQETFCAEGVCQTWFANQILNWLRPAPTRYLHMTTVQPSGTLDVSWNNSGSFDKILIRRLPTVQEAYALMAGSGSPSPTPTPTPSSTCTPTPYTGTIPTLPTTIQAENYDKCANGSHSEGITYHDNDP